MRSKAEEVIHNHVCNYIKHQYPNVVFTSDGSGVRVAMRTAITMKMQRSKHKIPDLLIFEPKGQYKGLFIEIKVDRSKVFKKNGELKKNDHVKEQYATLKILAEKGYFANFGFGSAHCIQIIDKYMKL